MRPMGCEGTVMSNEEAVDRKKVLNLLEGVMTMLGWQSALIRQAVEELQGGKDTETE